LFANPGFTFSSDACNSALLIFNFHSSHQKNLLRVIPRFMLLLYMGYGLPLAFIDNRCGLNNKLIL
jgi:hypothetical protein